MSDTTSESGRDSVEQLLESFLSRWRRGERPSLEEYAARCPERADEIRELFPALVVMEQLKPAVAVATAPPVRPSPEPSPAARPSGVERSAQTSESRRSTPMTRCPAPASSCAVAAPMPDADPVMT